MSPVAAQDLSLKRNLVFSIEFEIYRKILSEKALCALFQWIFFFKSVQNFERILTLNLMAVVTIALINFLLQVSSNFCTDLRMFWILVLGCVSESLAKASLLHRHHQYIHFLEPNLTKCTPYTTKYAMDIQYSLPL